MKRSALPIKRLELALIERALLGTEKIVRRKDGSEEVMREYPNAIALTLLRMHRDTAAEAMTSNEPPSDIDEIRDRILERMARMDARDQADRAEAEAE